MSDHDTIIQLRAEIDQLKRDSEIVKNEVDQLNNLHQRGKGAWFVITILGGVLVTLLFDNIKRFFNHI